MNLRWSPADIVAVMLAGAITIGLVSTAFTPYFLGQAITEARAENLSSVLDTLLGALIAYLGLKLRPGDKN